MTDNTIVLRCKRNKGARFHIFNANRLSVIRDGSEQDQQVYLDSEHNPADDSSRGTQSDRWLTWLDILYSDEKEWPKEPSVMSEETVEVKSFVEISICKPLDELLKKVMQYYPNWHRLKKAVVWLLRVRATLLGRAKRAQGLGFPKALKVKQLDEQKIP